MFGMKLGSIFAGILAADNGAVFKLNDRGVTRLGLTTQPNLKFGPVEWRTRPFSYGSEIVYSESNNQLLLQNTLGACAAIDASSGEVIWAYDNLGGEGGGPIFLDCHTILKSTWDGWIFLLNAADGHIKNSVRIPDKVNWCHMDPVTKEVFVETVKRALTDYDPYITEVRRLDIQTMELSSAIFQQSLAKFSVSPEGLNLASVSHSDDTDENGRCLGCDLEIIMVASRTSASRKLLLKGNRWPSTAPVWSVDGSILGLCVPNGHLFLDASTLEEIAIFPGIFSSAPFFSMDGQFVLLPSENSQIVPVSELAALGDIST